ncbi:hypothetical protein [Undibacterium terreum]|uniref:hypothetical protein n=1 Tax=Undibacterium terreum TaxID=1224302 RepID=UPI00166EEB9C|nr:hypothetical protein [Undibacterium terreum]
MDQIDWKNSELQNTPTTVFPELVAALRDEGVLIVGSRFSYTIPREWRHLLNWSAAPAGRAAQGYRHCSNTQETIR